MMIKLKNLVKEAVHSYIEKKTLDPVRSRDDRMLGKFFDNDEFGGKVSVINGTHLPLDIKVEKFANPERDEQYHLITITTQIPEPLIQQIKRMIAGK